jgi:hypothetical protein|nr:MAG TPA: hypothetical protein [Caudoviricetes sp.]
MAKTGCKVKIEWKGWKRGGYAEVMNSGGVQDMLDSHVDAAKAAIQGAERMERTDVASFNGRLARGRAIYLEGGE